MNKEIQNLELFKEVQAEKFYLKKKECLRNYVELGRILNETKEGLKHGEFINWLEDERVNFTIRTANRYMKIDKELGDKILNGDFNIDNLSLRKAFELASAPEEVREEIINNSESKEEIENKIKQLQEEKKAEREAKKLAEQKAKEAEQKAKELEEQLKNQPVKIEEKIVKVEIEKEIIPDDYEVLKYRVENFVDLLDGKDREIEQLKLNQFTYSEELGRREDASDLVEFYRKNAFGEGGSPGQLFQLGEAMLTLEKIIEQGAIALTTPVVIKEGHNNKVIREQLQNILIRLHKLEQDIENILNNGEIIIEGEII